MRKRSYEEETLQVTYVRRRRHLVRWKKFISHARHVDGDGHRSTQNDDADREAVGDEKQRPGRREAHPTKRRKDSKVRNPPKRRAEGIDDGHGDDQHDDAHHREGSIQRTVKPC